MRFVLHFVYVDIMKNLRRKTGGDGGKGGDDWGANPRFHSAVMLQQQRHNSLAKLCERLCGTDRATMGNGMM